ncbi:E3 ubiquitin-protein ligase rififylin-like [Sinocyclocheilus grahami]|uniref:E3 ubiquitin-protein ligase rififylin-like n=1 Tax=Sinocyclocheilus grahami TaxID=75366 RepID=UPI0007AD16AF|nr:PREDICTED: E3 ubiquitin-protein ligase rififylin-like [Sinocyclocheilus grahami]
MPRDHLPISHVTALDKQMFACCLSLCQSSDSEEVLAPGRRASLSDIRSVEDIEALSVRQLKEILARNFVDYKGCCEKWELMERVTRLYYDQKDLQNMVSNATEGTESGEDSVGMESQMEDNRRHQAGRGSLEGTGAGEGHQKTLGLLRVSRRHWSW